MINDYLSLSTRAGFNKSLSHFRMVTDIVRRMGQGENLAEIIDALEKSRGVEKSQIGPILNAIVIDRMEYSTSSFNLPGDVEDFDSICSELQKWNRINLIIAYHHPQLGISLLNPKLNVHWETIREFSGDELIVLYARAMADDDRGLEEPALVALRNLLIGRTVKDTARFGGGAAKAAPAKPAAPPPAAAPSSAPAATPMATPTAAMPAPPRPVAPPPAAAPSAAGGGAAAAPAPAAGGGGKVRMTPKYAVQVSNELFHNGNVEAWKNIVESYKTKHAGLDVHIFHDGQKVNNINALFKWGKVKHGDVIVFCVSGEDIKGVAKLQRYLYEGASIRFEHYLKKDVNKVLNLF